MFPRTGASFLGVSVWWPVGLPVWTGLQTNPTAAGEWVVDHLRNSFTEPFHFQRGLWLNQENFQILSCQTKPKGVTIQMKALSEHILMALLVLSKERASSFSCIFSIYMERERKKAVKGFTLVWKLVYCVLFLALLSQHCDLSSNTCTFILKSVNIPVFRIP